MKLEHLFEKPAVFFEAFNFNLKLCFKKLVPDIYTHLVSYNIYKCLYLKSFNEEKRIN